MLKSQEFAAILCINKPKGTYTYFEFSILFERWEVFSLALMYRGLFLFCSASLKGNLLGQLYKTELLKEYTMYM